jgi:HAD superfamily hydrolase (TIGR01509 family)
MQFKGLIFDLDGVLVDSEYFQWQGWVLPLRKFGIELSKEEYFHYAGKTASIIEGELIKNYNLDIKPGSLFHEKEKLLIEWFESGDLPLMPFAREAIEFFQGLNLKLAICSGGPRDEVHLKLKRKDLVKYFPVVVSRDDVINGKPSPDMYALAAEKIGLPPEECFSFEDTMYGLQAAKAAGLTCYAIPNEYSRKQDFSSADKVFKNLNEAVDFFKGP